MPATGRLSPEDTRSDPGADGRGYASDSSGSMTWGPLPPRAPGRHDRGTWHFEPRPLLPVPGFPHPPGSLSCRDGRETDAGMRMVRARMWDRDRDVETIPAMRAMLPDPRRRLRPETLAGGVVTGCHAEPCDVEANRGTIRNECAQNQGRSSSLAFSRDGKAVLWRPRTHCAVLDAEHRETTRHAFNHPDARSSARPSFRRAKCGDRHQGRGG